MRKMSELTSCVNVEVNVLGSPSRIVLMVSHAQSIIESEGCSEPRICVNRKVDPDSHSYRLPPFPNKQYGFCGRKSEFRSCVKVEVAALGSTSLTVLN